MKSSASEPNLSFYTRDSGTRGEGAGIPTERVLVSSVIPL